MTMKLWTAPRLAALGLSLGAGAALAAAGNEIKVSMVGSTYAPGEVKAKVGDTLVFSNDDFTTHWVYVPTQGYQVSRAELKEGETFKLSLRRAGSFRVACGLHENMVMTVTVAN
ncbi:cupredoxin domain-containing protein [Desertibaculum subflavum]|uniref:cupredoxin domain-containing protein n=1 Tax=Desertibaculum subflavum TaxID=2268458 RepID=UPI000E665EEE